MSNKFDRNQCAARQLFCPVPLPVWDGVAALVIGHIRAVSFTAQNAVPTAGGNVTDKHSPVEGVR